ncbi:MAG: VWA domain-containing protein [Actinomycetales bacterium]
MAGRHVDAQPRQRSRRRLLLPVVAVLAVGALVAGAAYYVFRPTSSSDGQTDSIGRCTSGVSLDVVTAPSIAAAVRDVAAHWTDSHPDLNGACPTVNIRGVASASQEEALAKPDVTVPDVWIPDSTLWVQRLRSDVDGTDAPARSLWLYPPIATSPLVLATSPERAGTLKAPARTWAATLGQATGVAMTNPASDTAGLLTLLTVQNELQSEAGTPTRALVSTLVRASQAPVVAPAAGFLALRDHPTTAAAFPSSEQSVVAAEQDTSGLKATSVYPTGKALELDFPVVQFSRPGGDPDRRNATVALVDQLRSRFATARFGAAGLRDAEGRPMPGSPATSTAGGSGGSIGSNGTNAVALERPPSSKVADGLRVWDAARRGSRTLMVIDLSGSMDERAGGQTKIRFAANAARSAVDFFPDTSSLGLWGFSVNRSGRRDWSELVSLGPLGARTTGGVRRSVLLGAASRLPRETGGATGLYNTTLAAYERVRSGWDPADVNSVVLLTDGANTDSSGTRLGALLSRLRSETSTSRPLPIITIAVGPGADVATLRRISTATHGRTYTVANPADIRAAFLDALISAGS